MKSLSCLSKLIERNLIINRQESNDVWHYYQARILEACNALFGGKVIARIAGRRVKLSITMRNRIT